MKQISRYTFTLLILLLSVSLTMLHGQPDNPKVSIIGEDDEAYEKMLSSCPDMMLNVADNSMDKAYAVWVGMLEDIQNRAEEENFAINGIKIWMNTFWNEDGTIKKLVYYPKPTSRNIDFQQLTDFLENFAADYKLPLTYDKCFSHYGSAAFPISSNMLKSQSNSNK